MAFTWKNIYTVGTFAKQLFWGPGKTAVCGVAVAAGMSLASPFILGAAGFTATGISAGSFASAIMSASAILNGGGVASMGAGGYVAMCQSFGSVGVPLMRALSMGYNAMNIIGDLNTIINIIRSLGL